MEVTQGRRSVPDRVLFALTGLAGLVVLGALWWTVPAAAWVLMVAALAVGLVSLVRLAWLAVLARGWRPRPRPADPAGGLRAALLIPCFDEVDSLRRTVPENLRALDGVPVRLVYVVEGHSSDGTQEYLAQEAARHPAIHVVIKAAPPGGRGACLQYGIGAVDRAEVAGFMDADHVVDRASMAAVLQSFEGGDGPDVVMGLPTVAEATSGFLALAADEERRLLLTAELGAGIARGGLAYFGGGIGFFRPGLLHQHPIDPEMILDDIDLSIRLWLAGRSFEMNPNVRTVMTDVPGLTALLDQRFRWARGWAQLTDRLRGLVTDARFPPRKRRELARFLLTPLGGTLCAAGMPLALLALADGAGAAGRAVALGTLGWPAILGLLPSLAGSRGTSPRRTLASWVGLPLLMYLNLAVLAIGSVHQLVLRRRPSYAKTPKA